MSPSLIDTDTLSEIIKGRDQHVLRRAGEYLSVHQRFTFSIITRYEILRGLKAKGAPRQIASFELRCRESIVLPLSDAIVEKASDIYGDLYRTGQLISDADILIAATAMAHGLDLVTENPGHFSRVLHLHTESWRTSA
jgi:tRNA(fMet)-specific endonuclease VapC